MFGLFLASLFVTYYIGSLWIIVALLAFDVYLFHNDDQSLWYSILPQVALGVAIGYWLRSVSSSSNNSNPRLVIKVLTRMPEEADRYIMALLAAVLFGAVYPIRMPAGDSDWVNIGRLAALILAAAFAVAESAISRQTAFSLVQIPAAVVLLDSLIFPGCSNERLASGIGAAIYAAQTLLEFVFIKFVRV
jgi:hypothetical protein